MKKNPDDFLREISILAEEYDLGVYVNMDSEEFRGFIIGTPDFVDDIADGVENLDSYGQVVEISPADGGSDGFH
jgi:hypothetical protein